MRKPQYWEDEEIQEQYFAWLKEHPEPEPQPLDPLAAAVARARGDILTDEDIARSINFLNRAAAIIKRPLGMKQ